MNAERPMIHMVGYDRTRCRTVSRLFHQTGYNFASFEEFDEFFRINRFAKCDCVLLDMSVHPDDRLRILSEVVNLDPGWPVICVDTRIDLKTVVRAMKSGAFDFILSSCSPAEFGAALDDAIAYRRNMQRQDLRRNDLQSRYEHLTAREKQVFAQLITGRQNKQIADNLGLAVQTVKIHRARIMAKMKASSVIELLQFFQTLKRPRIIRETPSPDPNPLVPQNN